jgi:WXXGXW repeat (2 copies)
MRLFRPARLLLMALLLSIAPAASHAGVFISVGFAPPPLPVYEQPLCPEPGLMWVPGYWAYGPDGYYWVPGAWVPAPYDGALWTPGYWGWSTGVYVWHPGYWGPHVGYYGGINYGFGYFGVGFVGGMWHGGVFAYNTAVMRVNTRVIHNVYVNRTVINRYTVAPGSRVAFSGGRGGINHPPSPEERAAEHEQHMARTSFQTQHAEAAMHNHDAYARYNGGHPQQLAAQRPLGGEARPTNQPRPPQQFHQAPQQRPEPQRTAPQYHAAPQQHYQPQARPEPQEHYQPQQRAAPQYHAAPQQHYQPQARPEPQRSAPRGHEESKPPHEDHPHGR